jgi:hypothetical protein
MSAIRDEPVEVLRRGDAPAQFLLRERLYVVRCILAHWVEPGGWRWSAPVWASPAEPVGGGGVAAPPLPRRAVPGRAGSAPAGPADREFWRVEAAAGRSSASALFDLCRAGEQPGWTVSLVEEGEES